MAGRAFHSPASDGSAASACTVPTHPPCAHRREQALAEHPRRAGDGVTERPPALGGPSPYPARIRSYFQFREIGAEIFIELVNGLKSHLRIQFLRCILGVSVKIQDLSALLRLFGNMLHQGHGDVLVPEILVHQQAVHADIPIGCENIAITHQLPAQIRAEVGQLFPEVPVVPHGKIISVQRAVVFQFVLFQLVCVRGLDRNSF